MIGTFIYGMVCGAIAVLIAHWRKWSVWKMYALAFALPIAGRLLLSLVTSAVNGWRTIPL